MVYIINQKKKNHLSLSISVAASLMRSPYKQPQFSSLFISIISYAIETHVEFTNR